MIYSPLNLNSEQQNEYYTTMFNDKILKMKMLKLCI